MNQFLIIKDEQNECAVPSAWRAVIHDIVESLRFRQPVHENHAGTVLPLEKSENDRIFRNIDAYGGNLASLPEDAWATSVCQWQDGYWEVLVDLFTIEEGRSDLALSLEVREAKNGDYIFHIESVNVP